MSRSRPSPSNLDIEVFATSLGLDGKAVVEGATHESMRNDCHICVDILQQLFQSSVITANEIEYQPLRDSSWLGSSRTWLDATAFFSPVSTEQVAVGLKVVVFLNVQFAIRSGGHCPLPQWSSIGNGIVFSMENFKAIELESSKKVVKVGVGCRWGPVFKVLEKSGLAAAGGHYADVGVGGFITGGGASYFSGSHGWGSDTAHNFEVVLSNGSVVDANARENSDLFWALKGGANNFGIVTRIDLYTIAVPDLIWGGSRIFSKEQIPAAIEALFETQKFGCEKDPNIDLALAVIKVPGKTLHIGAAALFSSAFGLKDRPASVEPFFLVPEASDSTKFQTLYALASKAGGGIVFQKGKRYNYGQVTIGISKVLYTEIIAAFEDLYAPLLDVPGLCLTISFNPIPSGTVKASNASRGNVFGLDEVAQCRVCLDNAWIESKDDDAIIAVDRAFLCRVEKLAREQQLLYRYVGMNNAGEHQDVLASNGRVNVERLREISKHYDAPQVFQELCSGGHKIPQQA